MSCGGSVGTYSTNTRFLETKVLGFTRDWSPLGFPSRTPSVPLTEWRGNVGVFSSRENLPGCEDEEGNGRRKLVRRPYVRIWCLPARPRDAQRLFLSSVFYPTLHEFQRTSKPRSSGYSFWVRVEESKGNSKESQTSSQNKSPGRGARPVAGRVMSERVRDLKTRDLLQ